MIEYTKYFDNSKFNLAQRKWIANNLKNSEFPLRFDDEAWDLFEGVYPVDKQKKDKIFGSLYLTESGTICYSC